MIVISTLSTALLVLYFRLRGGLKDFSVSYSIERPDDYARTVFLDSNRNYRIEYFPYEKDKNRMAGPPQIKEGILDKAVFRQAKRLLERSNLEKMKEFPIASSQKDNRELYTHFIWIKTKRKEKKIHLPELASGKLPRSLVKLIVFFDTFQEKAG